MVECPAMFTYTQGLNLPLWYADGHVIQGPSTKLKGISNQH